MPTVKREQLESIEWAGKVAGAKACPACSWGWCVGEHASDCWLSAALATPNTLPPVAVGDVVALDMEGYGRAETTVDADGDVLVVALNGYEDTPERTHEHYSDDAITAVYRRIWQRKETDRG